MENKKVQLTYKCIINSTMLISYYLNHNSSTFPLPYVDNFFQVAVHQFSWGLYRDFHQVREISVTEAAS